MRLHSAYTAVAVAEGSPGVFALALRATFGIRGGLSCAGNAHFHDNHSILANSSPPRPSGSPLQPPSRREMDSGLAVERFVG